MDEDLRDVVERLEDLVERMESVLYAASAALLVKEADDEDALVELCRFVGAPSYEDLKDRLEQRAQRMELKKRANEARWGPGGEKT